MLKVAKEGGKYLVSLFQVSKLNTLFSELISQQLNDLVKVPGRKVIFNLDGVRFIDSAGFSTLLKATEISRAIGSEFMISNISPEVQELIDLMSLNGTLHITQGFEVKEKIIMEFED